MKTLVIRFSAMGDVAMTSPVVASVARAYPDEQITVLTQQFLTPLFQDIPGVRTIGIRFADYPGLKGLFRLFRELEKERFDRVVDLHDVLRSKVLVALFRLSGIPCRVVRKGRAGKKALVSGRKRQPLKPMTERYRETFTRAGLPAPLLARAEKAAWPVPEAIREAAGEKKGKWYGVAPFAQHEGKRYPLDRTAELVRLLARNPDDRVFLFSGGGAEKEAAERIASAYPNVLAVFGRVPLHGELELMSNLDTLVSMDSGAMHFASLVGLRVVSVWGATHPYAGFLGWGQREEDAVQLDLPCRPCSVYGNKPCRIGGYPCLNGIAPETIYRKVVDD